MKINCTVLLFRWLKDFFTIGLKGQIEQDDIYVTKDNLNSGKITKVFEKLWDHELTKKNPSVARFLFKQYGGTVLFWSLSFSLLESCTRYTYLRFYNIYGHLVFNWHYNILILIRLLQPICLGGLVSYFAPGQTHLTKNDAYLYAGGIILSSAVSVLTFHPFILYIFEIGMQARLGCTGLLYRKVRNLKKKILIQSF